MKAPHLPLSGAPLQAGSFPHQAYRPACSCAEGRPEEQRNYQGHAIAPPLCSACRRIYRLDISLMQKGT